MSPLILQGLTAFVVTLSGILLFVRLAHYLDLTDKPSSRKHHDNDTPVIGGIAIFCALVVTSLIWGHSDSTLITVNGKEGLPVFMMCGFFLVVTGVLDDHLHLGILMRALSEIAVAIAVIEFLDLRLAHLGDLLAIGLITMSPHLAYLFTIVAIFGIVNAFNMIDGMDGLLASLVIGSLIMFHFFITTSPDFFSITIGGALVAFLMSNLDMSPVIPKTFLGDAGSKLLGFSVVCLLITAVSAQIGGSKIIQPVTALFIVALPLYDMVFTSLRRIIRKGSPFAADRSHIHHLVQDLGFSDRRALFLILSMHLTVTFIGLMIHRAETPEYYQFAIFIGIFLLYCLLASQAWIVANKISSNATLGSNNANPGSMTDVSHKSGSELPPRNKGASKVTPLN